MSRLPPEWKAHLAAGVSQRLGSCRADGRPEICRALAADEGPDGRMRVLVARDWGADVLAAIAETGQAALVAGLPTTHRTLHVKGHDATVGPTQPGDEILLDARLDALAAQLQVFGQSREALLAHWYRVVDGGLARVSFTVSGAWNQTPGPGAGQAIELQP